MDTSKFSAEEATLGSCLRWPESIADAAVMLCTEDWREDRQRKLWDAITGLYSRGVPVDLVTVADELQRRGHAQDVGYPYLAAVYEWGSGAVAVKHYAQRVRDRAVARDLGFAGVQLQALGESSAPADELLDEAERIVFGVADRRVSSSVVDADRALDEAAAEFDERCLRYSRDEPPTDPVSGFFDLDLMLSPFAAGEVTTLAARPSVGKSALALCIARNVTLTQGFAAYFVSLEMSRLELMDRLLCHEARVSMGKVRRGNCNPDEKDRMVAARDSLRGLPLHVEDAPGQTPLRLIASTRRLKLRHDIRLVVVDYLQLVDSGNQKAPRQEQVAHVSRQLKLLARECGVHVLALSQVNRASEGRGDGRPRLSDLRESGAIEQDSDRVLILHREEEKAPGLDQPLELLIAKQRNGATGDVRLSFAREYTRFGDWCPDAAQTRY